MKNLLVDIKYICWGCTFSKVGTIIVGFGIAMGIILPRIF
jgi:hypothetical protein